MSKPTLAKMALKPEHSAGIWNVPPGVVFTPPPGVESPTPLPGSVSGSPPDWGEAQCDWVLLFGTHGDELRPYVATARRALAPGGRLWIAYPKGVEKAALPTDLKREAVWALGDEQGLKAVAQIAVDEVWSALRFKVV